MATGLRTSYRNENLLTYSFSLIFAVYTLFPLAFPISKMLRNLLLNYNRNTEKYTNAKCTVRGTQVKTSVYPHADQDTEYVRKG